jgi:hypothetical protein
MPLSFTNDPDDPIDPDYIVEDASDEEEEQVVFETAFEGAEDEMKEEGSVVSASEFEDTGDLPERLLFGKLECRAIFTQKSDNGKFHRVCGCRATECTREGHSALRLSMQGRAAEGTYEPVRARKYVDGRYETHLPKEEYFAQMESLQQERRAGVNAAAAILKESPTGSEELGYHKARGWGDDARTPKPKASFSILKSNTGGRNKSPSTPERGSKNYEDTKPVTTSSPKKMSAETETTSKVRVPVNRNPTPDGALPSHEEVMARMMADFGNSTMKQFRDEFGHTNKAEGIASKKQASNSPVVPTRGKTQQDNHLTKHWYAVINGKGGMNSVFPEWIGGAAPYVTGVSGALSKKFNDFNEAWGHVEKHLSTVQRLKEVEEVATDGTDVRTAGLSMALPSLTATPPTLTAGHPSTNFPRPPLSLFGPDQSMKKNDELFGFEFGSEVEARDNLCPPGLTPEQARSLANTAVDVVALPGGFTSSYEEKDGSDMALMSAALEELVHQGRSGTENALKSDLQWRSEKRVGLRTVKDSPGLSKRLKILLKLRDRVIKKMIQSTVNVLKRAGWHDMDAINAWAVGGYYTKLVRESMDAWIGLHQHLLGLAITEQVPWSYVQVELEHHVEELETLRNTQDSRLQVLCANYVYLRDGHAGSWHSTSLQYKRNAELFTKVAETKEFCMPMTSDSEVKSYVGCIHCGTMLHTGGKVQCPWKRFSKKKAKLKANAALLSLADGTTPSDEDAGD